MSNRERVGRGFELLAEGLRPYVDREVSAASQAGANWFAAYQANSGTAGRQVSLDDPQVQLNVMRHFWELVFRKTLGRTERSLAFELSDTRNRWAHNEAFSSDAAYRALDSIELLLTAVSAERPAAEVRRLKDELMRARYAEQERRVATAAPASITTAPSAGLPPWREVVTPHADVASGTFQQAEFAADLAQVVRGEGAAEYVDPGEFFRRTYLTAGLRDLLTQAALRVSGRGGVPVVDLQTNFGGGKTHSLLALYHLFAGRPLGDLPPDVRELLGGGGVGELPAVRRAVLVGTSLSPGKASEKPDGTVVNTLWGELAWQLGGAEGYAYVADADRTRTSPGAALTDLLRAYTPCLVLIDEWVAYARQLYSRDDLPGGSFDVHFTFAQTLTEATRAVPGSLTVVSLPASEGGSDAEVEQSGSALEVGGVGGREALNRLKNVIGRMEAAWRPASAEESFEIVRRRLFEPMTDESRAKRQVAARAFADYYRRNAAEFPAECRDQAYEQRITAAYPIHPELFDRLYSDWSTLDRFQRTRGVLRLMAAVVHSLWVRNDQAPVILPASLPLDDTVVRTELTRYLDDNWAPILDQDVDGPNSLPVRLDTEVTNLGRYLASRRVARTVFLGSAPTLHSANRGIDGARVRLGCVLPGESIATFGDALNRLSGRATYLYAAGGRYWFGIQPGVTRIAADRAERLLAFGRDEVQLEIEARLKVDRGDFAGVHASPRTSADVADEREARLVILPPTAPHIARSEESAALSAARELLERRGSAAREYRNMLVFLAADHRRLEELETAVADFLAWKSVHGEAGEEGLNLDPNQARQARTKYEDANRAVELRMAETYQHVLVPAQPDPLGPIRWDVLKAEGQGGLAVRAGRRVVNEGALYVQFAPAVLRMQLDGVLEPLWSERGHVDVRTVWDAFVRYRYLPRLRSIEVLLDAVRSGPANLAWQQDGFATAEAYDETVGRYVGLTVGGYSSASASTLLVRPDVAMKQLELETVVDTDETEPSEQAVGASPGAPTLEDHRVRSFYGVAALDPERASRDFGRIAQEVLQHLTSADGTDVEVTVEVRAKTDEGFTSALVRTVSENAHTLRFKKYQFDS